MTNRDVLHGLVDSLPEDAMGATQRILQHYQRWPPLTHLDGKQLHEKVRKRFQDHAQAHPPLTGQGGRIAGYGGSGNQSPDGNAWFSSTGWEGDTAVEVKYRVFSGHKLEFETRLRLSEDKSELVYTEIVKGPGGKEDFHEISFKVNG